VEQKPEELVNQLFRFYSAGSTKIPCCVMNVEGDGKGTEEVTDGCTYRDADISPRFGGQFRGEQSARSKTARDPQFSEVNPAVLEGFVSRPGSGPLGRQ
jgi:hypothetical protein